MSAHKSAIVRLGEAEYQRLRGAEEKLRLLELDGSSHKIDQERKSIFEQMLSEGRASGIQFNSIVNGLVQDFSEQALAQSETTQWIQSQNEILQARLIQTEQETANWAQEVSEALVKRERLLEQKQNELDLHLFEQKNVDISDARNEIERAFQLLEYLQNQYRFDLQSANELEIQRNEIEESERLLNNNREDRAWFAARIAANGLVRLRHHLESQRAVISACRADLMVTARLVVNRIQNNQVVYAMDADGNEIPEQIDVDYWTEGAYRKLTEQAEQAENAVNDIDGTDLNEFSEWKEEFKLLDERAVVLITQARLAILASQLRFNVAQIVVKALETQGFFLEEAAYQQNDFRASFMARTRNMSGSEVLITIDPDPGLDEGGRVHINSEDAQPVTQHELLQRNREIFQAIRQEGLVVSDLVQNSPELPSIKPLKSQVRLAAKKTYES